MPKHEEDIVEAEVVNEDRMDEHAAEAHQLATTEGERLPAIPDSSIVAGANPAGLTELIYDNLDGELRPQDLLKITVPAAGGQRWTLPASGDSPSTFEGVIVGWNKARAYWTDDLGQGDVFPACTSGDAKVGHGKRWDAEQATHLGAEIGSRELIEVGDDDEGPHDCGSCPLSQFGSKGEGRGGQACREFSIVLVMRPGQILPTMLRVPPSSLKHWAKYRMELTYNGASYWRMTTRFGLSKEKSREGGIDYAAISFAPGEPLSPEETAVMRAYRSALDESWRSDETAMIDAKQLER